MPLPLGDAVTAWPPVPFNHAINEMRVWSAWYEGDSAKLQRLYSGLAGGFGYRLGEQGVSAHLNRPSDGPLSGGVFGAWKRFWYGRQGDVQSGRQTGIHVPIAADLCSVSADLLFSDPLTVEWPQPADAVIDENGQQTVAAEPDPVNQQARERLDALVNTPAMHAKLLEAAELQAALGGVYLRLGWDITVSQQVMLDVVDADHAVPEFSSWGPLQAVTFWSTCTPPAGKGQLVYRWLERHEPGRILHGLYQGTADGQNTTGVLGIQIPLGTVIETAGLTATLTDPDQLTAVIPTVPGRLTAAYVPNRLPNRVWRNRGPLANLGRSDLDGVEPLMDALDEVYSSLMRDLRLGKGRLTVPETMLEGKLEMGRGAQFEIDREVYSPVNSLGVAETGAASEITVSQFAIRVQEHLDSAQGIVREILREVGYSPITFGIADEVAVTATEINSREAASNKTRATKLRYWLSVLPEFWLTMVQLDAAKFGTGAVCDTAPTVVPPSAAREPLAVRAQAASLLSAAGAASTRTLVELVNPDWSDEQVAEEVEAIEKASAAAMPAMPDPTTVGIVPNAESDAEQHVDGRGGLPTANPGSTADAVANYARGVGARR